MSNIRLYALRYTTSPMQFLRAYFQNAATATEVSRETTNIYWTPEVAVWPKFAKCKNEKQKRIRFSFFVFLTSL